MNTASEGFVSAKDGIRLFWRCIVPPGTPKAWLAVMHGYGEHSGRYVATMNSLADAGFASVAIDYRGHGRADGRRADVSRWYDYFYDIERLLEKVNESAKGAPQFLVAHSHGALISTHYMLRGSRGLKGLVMTSPYYRLAFDPPPLKVFGGKLIQKIMPGFHIGNELKVEQLTRDPKIQQETAADSMYLHVTTPRWFFEHKAAQDDLAGRGKELTMPVFIGAGTDDPIASTPSARAFFDTIASTDKTWKEYEGFRHEVLNEIGRERVIADIVGWISARC